MDLERVGKLVLQVDGLLLGEVEVFLLQALLSDLAPQQLVEELLLLQSNPYRHQQIFRDYGLKALDRNR